MKRVLFDIGHPAQVHNFKYVFKELTSRDYECLFAVKEKEVLVSLLKYYELPFKIISKKRNGLFNKILFLPKACFRFLRVVLSFKPDVIVSRSSIHSSWISFLLGKDHIALSDTEHVKVADRLTVPFVNTKLTAYSYHKDLGHNHLRYNGNIELFYLHPNRFKPDISIFKELGLQEGEEYAIVRFVSWDAHHDVGEQGFTFAEKENIIQQISKRMCVFVTSEGVLPESLRSFQISIPPEKMHDALAFASLYVGEGGTMASEAALLGTPAIYVNTLTVGYVEEEAEFGLVYSFRGIEGVITCLDQLLKNENLKAEFEAKRDSFLSNKIDPTAFLVWFVENYPESRDIMKKDSDYQYRFK